MVTVKGRSAKLNDLLALNALLFTLVLITLIGVAISYALGRPLFRVVNKACETIDREREARDLHERLEKEEEARHRAQAEKELDEQFPHLKDGTE